MKLWKELCTTSRAMPSLSLSSFGKTFPILSHSSSLNGKQHLLSSIWSYQCRHQSCFDHRCNALTCRLLWRKLTLPQPNPLQTVPNSHLFHKSVPTVVLKCLCLVDSAISELKDTPSAYRHSLKNTSIVPGLCVFLRTWPGVQQFNTCLWIRQHFLFCGSMIFIAVKVSYALKLAYSCGCALGDRGRRKVYLCCVGLSLSPLHLSATVQMGGNKEEKWW